jgi:hypothetical protein
MGPAGFAGLYDRGMAFDELLADRVRTCLQQVAGSARRRCSAAWPS